MTSSSSGASTEQLKTVSDGRDSSSSSSDLSPLSLLAEDDIEIFGQHNSSSQVKGKLSGGGKGKKRERERSTVNGPTTEKAKKVKIEADGEPKERGIYCHQ